MGQGILIADSLISGAAILGLSVALWVLRRAGPADAQSGRFQLGLIVVAVFLAGRLMWWLTGAGAFLTLLMIAAALIPLSSVILTEGLLRRHASPWIKTTVLTGAAAFAVLAFAPVALVEPYRSLLLLGFQLVGFMAVGWLVLCRDKAALSPRENWLIDRIALSLLLILPFLLTEFRLLGLGLPIRLGGVAILTLCWLAISLGRSNLGHRATISVFAVIVATALAAGLGIARIGGLDAAGTLQSGAIILSALLLAATITEAMNLRADTSRDSVLRQIASSRGLDAAAFLDGLRAQFATEGAVVLGLAQLEGFDQNALLAAFSHDPLQLSSSQDEQLQALFTRYQVSHLMLIGQAPLTIVALNLPSMASQPGVETELRAIQLVASLMSERGHD